MDYAKVAAEILDRFGRIRAVAEQIAADLDGPDWSEVLQWARGDSEGARQLANKIGERAGGLDGRTVVETAEAVFEFIASGPEGDDESEVES